MPKRKRRKKNKFQLSKKKRKVWFFGNLGGQHRDLKVPEGIDMAIFTGDIANQTGVQTAYDFIQWYQSLKIDYKIFIPGGKDAAFSNNKVDTGVYMKKMIMPNSRIIQAKGLSIFGSPMTDYRRFQNQHDGYVISEEKMLEMTITWGSSDIDIVATNDAPYGILDLKASVKDGEVFSHHGSEYILDFIIETKPKIHAFSKVTNQKHIANAGLYTHPAQNTLFVNCACVDDVGKLDGHGIVLEI